MRVELLRQLLQEFKEDTAFATVAVDLQQTRSKVAVKEQKEPAS